MSTTVKTAQQDTIINIYDSDTFFTDTEIHEYRMDWANDFPTNTEEGLAERRRIYNLDNDDIAYRLHEDSWMQWCEDFRTITEYMENKFPKGFIALADLGLWNGRTPGYLFDKSFTDVITRCFQDRTSVYVDNTQGTLNVEGGHHDGTNYIEIRAFKTDLSDQQYAKGLQLLQRTFGDVSVDELDKYTCRLGKETLKALGLAV